MPCSRENCFAGGHYLFAFKVSIHDPPRLSFVESLTIKSLSINHRVRYDASQAFTCCNGLSSAEASSVVNDPTSPYEVTVTIVEVSRSEFLTPVANPGMS